MWIRGKLLFILEAKVRKIAPELAVDHVDECLQKELENHAKEKVGVAHKLNTFSNVPKNPPFTLAGFVLLHIFSIVTSTFSA